ncbi:radical SAM family heme chaperone HemW [Alphaproteobacteria bacterium]|nr:radical SAM family heme chaperone HemW [Alphaproteobacteria bacterium]
MKPAQRDLAVYIHWPFCLSKCPYCDFNSHVAESVNHKHWRDALLAELSYYAARLPERRIVSIFFGGGTPSLMEPATSAALIDSISNHWPLVKDIEITLEANPTSIEAGRFQDFRSAGINRLSIGVQALDNQALGFLGRGHDQTQAIEAVVLAGTIFPRTSFDLIYARPDQTIEAWKKELSEALAMQTGHLSLYQLTIERGTPFYAAHRRGDFQVPSEGFGSRLYEATQELCAIHGRPAYEISNHAMPGSECRHNLVYWRGGDYVGIGPGAHGRLSIDGNVFATEQIPGPKNWLAAITANGHGTRKFVALDATTRLEEILMMGLRLRDGLTRTAFQLATTHEFEDVLEPRRLRRLIAANYLEIDARGLRATSGGLVRLNAVLATLLA